MEFQIEGAHPFTSYSYTNENYMVTPEYGGSISISAPDDSLSYLKPEFTLGPYTSTRGHILFWMHDKKSIQPGTHKMTVVTSRKKFAHEIKIGIAFESEEENLYKKPKFLPYE